jgi:hypothetical protein
MFSWSQGSINVAFERQGESGFNATGRLHDREQSGLEFIHRLPASIATLIAMSIATLLATIAPRTILEKLLLQAESRLILADVKKYC